MATPIVLPELGVSGEPIQVSCWLIDVGDHFEINDRIIEVKISGVTFDVAAETAGRLTRIEKSFDMDVLTGDILGWIEPTVDEDEDIEKDVEE